MSAAEKRHLQRVRDLGCIVCGGAAIAHHIRSGQSSGMGKKASDFHTIPLCGDHHTDGGYGIAYHAGPRIWQERYGSEIDLLVQTTAMLAAEDA
jgi:hypothetical protein